MATASQALSISKQATDPKSSDNSVAIDEKNEGKLSLGDRQKGVERYNKKRTNALPEIAQEDSEKIKRNKFIHQQKTEKPKIRQTNFPGILACRT